MPTLTLERVEELINESREYDNQCKMPPASLVEQLTEVYKELPKFKSQLSAEQFRFYRAYISDTVYVAKGIALK